MQAPPIVRPARQIPPEPTTAPATISATRRASTACRIINSSQGGGGIFIHGWAHNLEVANTRISGNHGTLAGGINLGNGETPDAFYINDGAECGTALTGANAVMPCPPIPSGTVTNAAIPFQWNTKVRIHHNMIYNNASIGDALFSGTPAGAGAITVSAGADDYQIDHNWIAGNMSVGDGGGVQHLGLSFRGNINHNYILFNQSTNPTLPTNGGGLIIEGANLDRQLNGQECGSTTDQDCPPGLGEGAGSSIVIDSNLILGNSAESGSGGGVRLQQVNGSEVIAFPGGPDPHGSPNATPGWYDVTMTNNIIANNVAGWDGGGVSLQDALKVTFVNNTVASNDTTASAGALFKTLGTISGLAAAGMRCADRPDAAAGSELHRQQCPARPAAGGPGRDGEHAEPDQRDQCSECQRSWPGAVPGKFRLHPQRRGSQHQPERLPQTVEAPDGERPVLAEPLFQRGHHRSRHGQSSRYRTWWRSHRS